ncbi:MAG: nucleotidyltransferase domain-containing protein [Planctomycetota bacterium]
MADLIHSEVRASILHELSQIEDKHDVRILYACESGSRAWGFESKDSDYDVRFLYVRPRDWYLSIDVERRRDVIELPIDEELDINGWDLRKALQLFRKSNPPLLEWLNSPIVYLEKGVCANRMRELSPATFNPIAAHYHYLRMAENNYKAHLRGQRVRRKKYLYVLRPLLAVLWINQEKGVVPTEFDKLVQGVVDDVELVREIESLLRAKRAGKEVDAGPRYPRIHDFIDNELTRHRAAPAAPEPIQVDNHRLSELFREILGTDEMDLL